MNENRSITCLTCLNTFDVEVNGKKLMQYEKTGEIVNGLHGVALECKCGSKKLIFSSFYGIKLKYPK